MTSRNVDKMVHFRVKDTNNIFGLGVQWVNGIVMYQNGYGSQYGYDGKGIVWTAANVPYAFSITGTSTLTLTKTLMAESVKSIVDTNTLKVTKNFNTIVVSFVNTGIKNGDNLGAAIGNYRPSKIVCTTVADSLTNSMKIIELYTNGTCAVYNTNFTSYTAPINAVGELVFHTN